MRNKTLIAIGVIVLLITAPFFIPSEGVRKAAEDAASEAFGAKVSIEALSVQLLPTPGVTIKNAALHDVDGGFPRLKVESGRVSLALLPLLSGQIKTRAISFNNIFLRISKKARGKAVLAIWIDKLKGTVYLDEDKLNLLNWQAQLYGGKIELDAEVLPLKGDEVTPLEGEAHTISGEMHAVGIAARRLLRDAAGHTKLGGTLSSDLKFSATGADEDALYRSLMVDGPIHLRKGSIYQIELKGIASMLVPGSSKGKGDIAYRNLDLELQVRGRDVYARNMKLASDVADARGNMAIKEDESLEGEIGITALGGLIDVKLRIGGTVDEPQVLPPPPLPVAKIVKGVSTPVDARVDGAADVPVEKVSDEIKELLDGT